MMVSELFGDTHGMRVAAARYDDVLNFFALLSMDIEII
jgi:hypothetical protein